MKKLTHILFVVFFIHSTAFAQTFLGDYTSHKVFGKTVTVQSGSSAIRFTFFKPDILKVDFLPTLDTEFDSSFVVIRDTTEHVNFSVHETDSTLEIISSGLTVRCRKTPLRVSFFDATGKLVLAEPQSGGFSASQKRRSAHFTLAANDHFYGTGERGVSLDLRGRAFDSYNTQTFGYADAPATMNINIPFLASSNGYALYFENTYSGHFDLGNLNPEQFQYTATKGELSYFLIAAPTIAEQLEKYTWLTGRQPLLPRWAFGFIQSKFGYENETEARVMVETMREKQIPCDAIILDLFWFQHMGDIDWNFSSWPSPFQMMSDFLAQGFKTIVITEPYITEVSTHFAEAVANGYLGQFPSTQPYLLNNWWSCGCDAGLLDITNPAAQQWWWDKHPPFFGNELAGIWTDLGEPERHPSDMLHFLGQADKIHNIYNLLWAKTIFDGFDEIRPNQRLINLTRSGYAGIQRYGVVTWSGDVSRSFRGLAAQPRLMLNMGLSGLGYHNSDIGGFCCGSFSPELYVRWMQFGTFCPVTRAHGTGLPTEPWAYGQEAEEINRKYIRLRYRLLPYIYTMAFENYQTGTPMARPLFFEDPDDPNLDNDYSSYMWGESFLVSPVVTQRQSSKTVYLPQGVWIDYWTDEEVKGGQAITVATPLETMPLFVKAGSIIPMQPVMNYTDERPLDTLTVAIYPSPEKDADFVLYEDDGQSLAYQSGGFAQTSFSQRFTDINSNNALEITIGAMQGNYNGKLPRRVYLADVHNIENKPAAVSKNGEDIPEKFSLQDLQQGTDGFYFDDTTNRLFVQVPASTDSAYTIIAEDVQLITAVEEKVKSIPGDFVLEQNYPNPFNPSTTIRYKIAVPAVVALKVYDVLGREVVTLVNERKQAGEYTAAFNANDVVENGLASGTYFYKLTARPVDKSLKQFYSETKKLILVK